MRYFTRELFEAIQVDDEAARDAWTHAVYAYREHFERVEAELPESARAAAPRSWDDAVIRSIEVKPGATLELVLDGSNCPFSEGEVRVTFGGVEERENCSEILGDTWVQEEWACTAPGLFELSVLTDKHEFRVVAREIDIAIGEFPVHILGEHWCVSDPPNKRFRIVKLTSPDSERPEWYHHDSWTPDTPEADDVLVRNFPQFSMEIRYCPYCGQRLE